MLIKKNLWFVIFFFLGRREQQCCSTTMMWTDFERKVADQVTSTCMNAMGTRMGMAATFYLKLLCNHSLLPGLGWLNDWR